MKRSTSRVRLATTACAASLLALAPAAVANGAPATGVLPWRDMPAALAPMGSGQLGPLPFSFRFVPPAVGPITSAIGPVIIDGQVISPGLRVTMPGVSLPPMAFGWAPELQR